MDISKQNFADHRHGVVSIKLHKIYASCAFLLTAAACFAGSIGSRMLMLGITAMFALLIFKPEYLMGPVLFFSIFDDFLLIGSSSSASRIVTIFYILGATVSVLKRGSIRKMSIYYLLLIAFGVMLSYYSTKGYTSFPITYVLNIILTIAMINFSGSSSEKITKQLYMYGALALLYVYFLLWKNGFDSLVDGTRMTIGENVNSNQLAKGLAVVMALLVGNLILFKRNIFWNVLLIIANLLALFLTGSRTALIAVIVAAFLLYVINAQDKRHKRRGFILLIVSIGLLVVIYNTLQKNFPLLMKRFTVDNVEETGGSGRMDVWIYYFTYLFPKHWFIGMGFNTLNLYYALVDLGTEGHGAHNLLVEILSRSGVVGLILYTTCIVQFFRVTIKKMRENVQLLIPIGIVITILLNGIGENELTTRFLWFGIGLGYMLMNTEKKENKTRAGGDYNA